MSTLIQTPTTVQESIYEGEMEPSDVSLEKMAHEKGPASLAEARASLPTVTLGMPQWWNLSRLAKTSGRDLPAEMSLQLQKSQLYLLQLACSFRPTRDSHIEWARLTAFLEPRVGSAPVIALDLYPRQIIDEAKTDVKVTLGPSLKFSEVEGKLGEAVTTIHLTSIKPVVVGYGALESTPNWDYFQHKDHPILGAYFGYLIVKKPLQADAVRLTLDLTAEIASRDGMFGTRLKKADTDYYSKTICFD